MSIVTVRIFKQANEIRIHGLNRAYTPQLKEVTDLYGWTASAGKNCIRVKQGLSQAVRQFEGWNQKPHEIEQKHPVLGKKSLRGTGWKNTHIGL